MIEVGSFIGMAAMCGDGVHIKDVSLANLGIIPDAFRRLGVKVEEVVIHTKTEYQHGLLLTKPLHHSQKETLPFGKYENGEYGEVTLTIEPNRELRGKILAYGQYLEVIQPLLFRDQIKEIIRTQMKLYFGE